ncbi:hypothetical protein PN498_27980 [Oscillatoria sp. CS-180]|uniref:hypothetical protein n=1 Tax=Oscillatoria sp. CS-180 TaxID=3021720 RepID=UPI00232BB65A|nr:hypothetical protein [Oscillatoria sp. CS-180]MDB9529858.1 hypothetical protein [Oscillatoria sp. CS-180]
MARLTSIPVRDASEDNEIWANLREAIANSSGFESWQQQKKCSSDTLSLDTQVRLYLRETLETLAY